MNIKKIISFLNVFSIANIAILLIYNFENSRYFIKNIIVAVLNEEVAININNIYLMILPSLKWLIYIYIIFILVVVIYKMIKYYINRFKQRKEAMQASGINKDLYDYLNDYDKKCFVITGDWGVGKTYTVDNFFDRYFKYEKRDVYRISCFGMENRKEVLEELKNVFEKQDKSLRKYTINILNKIPIIGGLLEDALKSDYEFKDLKERSIFIFDDLERINIPKYKNRYTREWYRVRNIRENPRERTPLNEIYKEFKEVEGAFGKIDNSLEKIKEEINIEKFNVITGLINELIERYNMKVIVICNKEEIDKKFFYDVFECKIESILYKIKTEHDITVNLTKRNINDKLYLEKNIKKEIEEFFIDNAECIDNIWAKNNISNVRILSKSISAFIEIVENYKIEKEYLIRTYECDRNENLRLLTLMNIFQDVADSHASAMGLGLEYCLSKGFAWVGSNYHLQIARLPKMHEKIKVQSWPAVEKKLGAIREFLVQSENGDTLIKASSQWILIDAARRRPIALRENLPMYQVIGERVIDTDFPKISEPQKIDEAAEFFIRFDDIDLNNHVNNAVYPLWASEAVGIDFRAAHTPAEIEIAFKKEGLYGEDIRVETEFDNLTTIHRIKATGDGRELARVRICWIGI